MQAQCRRSSTFKCPDICGRPATFLGSPHRIACPSAPIYPLPALQTSSAVHRSRIHAFQAPKPPIQAPAPWQQRVLNTILSTSAVPYSSFVALPITFLHRIDARVKQLWLVTLFMIIARASPPMRFAIAGSIATITVLNFPRRLWASQLQRLSILCAFLFVLTAIGSDSVPPLLQPRSPPPALDAIPPVTPLDSRYSYVILHVWFITITRRFLPNHPHPKHPCFLMLCSTHIMLTHQPAPLGLHLHPSMHQACCT